MARLRVRGAGHPERVPRRGAFRAGAGNAAGRSLRPACTSRCWTRRRVLAREPALKPGVAGGFFNPGDAHLRPDRYVAELARCVRARADAIEENTRVEGIVREGARITRVATTRGDFRGRDVVLALGAWSPQLARQLGLRIPIQPGKGYSITYTRPALCPRIPLVLKERSVCVTAWSSGYRLGSTMEFAGYDTSLNRTRLDALKRGAAEYLHEPEGPGGRRGMVWLAADDP